MPVKRVVVEEEGERRQISYLAATTPKSGPLQVSTGPSLQFRSEQDMLQTHLAAFLLPGACSAIDPPFAEMSFGAADPLACPQPRRGLRVVRQAKALRISLHSSKPYTDICNTKPTENKLLSKTESRIPESTTHDMKKGRLLVGLGLVERTTVRDGGDVLLVESSLVGLELASGDLALEEVVDALEGETLELGHEQVDERNGDPGEAGPDETTVERSESVSGCAERLPSSSRDLHASSKVSVLGVLDVRTNKGDDETNAEAGEGG